VGKMDELCQVAINLIIKAGESRSKSLMAVKAARQFRFEEAKELLKEAEEEMREAHQIQTELIQKEAGGQKTEVTLILVHAQDHLNNAMMTLDMAREMQHLYGMIHGGSQ